MEGANGCPGGNGACGFALATVTGGCAGTGAGGLPAGGDMFGAVTLRRGGPIGTDGLGGLGFAAPVGTGADPYFGALQYLGLSNEGD